jgi:F-type H+-transporting ATPase subunit c
MSLLAYFIPTVAFAVEETAGADSGLAKFGLAIGAGIGLGIAAACGAYGQGRAVSAAMEGLSRNPGASDKMFMPLILGLVFIESLVIYMLVMAFFLQGKI